jgi:dihydroorotase
MAEQLQTLTLARPDDWHHHLRDGAALATTVPFAARTYGRAICMPNLVPPVTTAALAVAYKERIMKHVPKGSSFEPLMTLYLTDSTSPQDIKDAKASGVVVACKLYPKGATTNSHGGVTDIKKIWKTLDAMEEHGLLLLVHGEATGSVDVFERERSFLESTFKPLVLSRPGLRIVLEHCTTAEAAEFIQNGPPNVCASVTPQHLLFNRNHMLAGGIKPHLYCMPILKAEEDRAFLVKAVTAPGQKKFFLGTDSAPHEVGNKHSACGCAGVFSAHASLEFYAEVFEDAGCLERLEAFSSQNGADFYGFARNTETVVLKRETWTPPAAYPFAGGRLVPLRAGETIRWKLQEREPGFCASCK